MVTKAQIIENFPCEPYNCLCLNFPPVIICRIYDVPMWFDHLTEKNDMLYLIKGPLWTQHLNPNWIRKKTHSRCNDLSNVTPMYRIPGVNFDHEQCRDRWKSVVVRSLLTPNAPRTPKLEGVWLRIPATAEKILLCFFARFTRCLIFMPSRRNRSDPILPS